MRAAKSNPAPGFVKHPDHKMVIGSPDVTASAAIGSQKLASSNSAIRLSEANYGDVIYFPREDVDMTALEATDTSSFCPFKGTARYWRATQASENSGDSIDICWSYEDPFDEAGAISTYIAFYADRVTVTSS